MSRWVGGIIIAGLLAGCQGQVETTPQPIIPLEVQITPALDWLRPTMAACAVENPDLSLTVDSTNLADQTLETADEHTSELQSPKDLVCRLLLEKKKKK